MNIPLEYLGESDIIVVMYITKPIRTSQNGKTYQSILLRESYREAGKVKNRTLANLTHCKPEEVAAIEFALKHKEDLAALPQMIPSLRLQQGFSVGAVWTVYQLARRLGIENALGTRREGKLALWQVMTRVIDQGSRLSAVRLAPTHAGGDVLGMDRGVDENDLYENLTWLSAHQEEIEQRLFTYRRGRQKPNLFLYDVTSTYLEGNQNELADFGYNRDGKKGKKQLVIGLLCDEEGDPVSTEVFTGNTSDMKTLKNQVDKAAERFGCERVTFVGDRGMIKSRQIADLTEMGFHYITAITKPQIETLIRSGAIQLEFFDETLCEIVQEGTRYILRRNPHRAEEIAATRREKQHRIEKWAKEKSEYLQAHPRASAAKARDRVQKKIAKLLVHRWLAANLQGRTISLQVDALAVETESRLDGCYVIKTDLPEEAADSQLVHDRYKDLAEVERAFRTCKTAHLEVRPVYVRTKENTRGHVLVVMLAYLLIRALRQVWSSFDLTVEEGLKQLTTLCSIEVRIQGQATCQKIPVPRETSQQHLQALQIKLPEVLPCRNVRVVTRKKLQDQRKSL